jgi:hypothetical protein
MADHSELPPEESRPIIQVTFGLSEEDIANLKLHAAIRNTSPAQVVREALATETHIARAVQNGSRIFVLERPPQSKKRLVRLLGRLSFPMRIREITFPQFESNSDRSLDSTDIPPAAQ